MNSERNRSYLFGQGRFLFMGMIFFVCGDLSFARISLKRVSIIKSAERAVTSGVIIIDGNKREAVL